MELSPQQDVYYIDTVSPIDYFIDTVTPSAIQLNKEKTMSIELDGPLYLGSNSLQQQVDQNTEDITELQSDVSSIEGDIGSLDNLATSDKSSLVNAINETLSVLDPTQTADYIKNSKGLESGEISTNASILPWVEEMSHSTFDRSKFTVVGSPNITDDGIASGFSQGDGINAYTLDTSKPFSIKGKFHTSNAPNAAETILGVTTLGVAYIYWYSQTKNIVINLSTSTGSWNIVQDNNSTSTLLSNTSYYYDFNWDGSVYTFNISTDGENWTTCNTISSSSLIGNGSWAITIGSHQAAYSSVWQGSIDLKQFSITVDGVEVFSGNRTGIDTIKPDDYTVVGTPTISADGIASGFSSSNFLRTPTIDFSKPFEIIFEEKFITRPTGLYSNLLNIQGMTSGNNIGYYIQAKLASDSFAGIFNMVVNNTIHWEFIKFLWTGEQYKLYSKENANAGWVLRNTYDSTIPPSTANNTTTAVLVAGYNLNSTYSADGSIDLNAFKIYVDGNLVYQPCLKIPFMLSKTGAKIVDSIYRDRVSDMYEQFGYAPYYTLDTTNSNYTIPKGEVYGMVNKLIPTLIAPDYSKPVSLTYSSGLVMENDGWLEVQIQSSEATANPYVSINGSIICRTSVNSNGDLNRDTAMMVVRKGDIITSGGYSADTAIVLTYYPFKV